VSPNPLGLDGADLFASTLLRLAKVHGGRGYLQKLWSSARNLPTANTTQDAQDNFVLAASTAANANLVDVFTQLWKWKLSPAVTSKLSAQFGRPVAVTPYQ
jgi:hypothetical protein